MNVIDVDAAASLGAQLLDIEKPRWYDKIDLDMLDIQSHLFCVLGQVYGRFGLGMAELDLTNRQVFEFGFDLDPRGWDDRPSVNYWVWLRNYAVQLAESWRLQILTRRDADELNARRNQEAYVVLKALSVVDVEAMPART